MTRLAFFISVGLMLCIFQVEAQRFVYVDTEFILENLPTYQKAESDLDKYAMEWQTEIKNKQVAIDQAYNNLKAEEILLTEEMKKKRMSAINSLEKELKDLQHKRFGPNGDLFKKREELIQPIQDKIFEEIQKMAQKRGLDFVFDKSNGVSMLYANEKYDKSEDILRALKFD